MGGAVSSGRDNDELIDNLMGGNYIRTRSVERVFRSLDRADYMTPDARDQAYKDLAWRSGPLHMSAPCIYRVREISSVYFLFSNSEVMESLELKPGLSFLNIGSGTGYLSTLVGLILGSGGINHGVEVRPVVVEYANKKLSQFLENSASLDEFDFCEPKFYMGNGLCLAPLPAPYDRVYCGAACPEEYQNYFKQLIKVNGVLVMPLNDNLVQVRRTSETEWTSSTLLNVSFASLREPTKEEAADLVKLDEQTPPRLQVLARASVREAMRGGLLRRHPELREPPPRQPPAKKSCPRRICIPIEDDSDVEGLNALHDLDPASGANEMNALLSLVLSMGQNRVAGSLRVGHDDISSGSSDDDEDDDDRPPGGGRRPGDAAADSDDRRADDHGADDEDDTIEDNDDDDDDDSDNGGGVRKRLYLISHTVVDARERPSRTAARHRGVFRTFEFRDRPSGPRGPAGPDPDTAAEVAEKQSTDVTDRLGGEAESSQNKDSAESSTNQDEAPFSVRTVLPMPDSAGSSGNWTVPADRDESRPNLDAQDENQTVPADRHEDREVPAEVEIYLGKTCEATTGAGNSDMQWEAGAEPAAPLSSDEETAGDTDSKGERRKKLDSGLGEENSPSSESSPVKSDSKSDESERSDSLSDEVTRTARRRQKRGRGGRGVRGGPRSWSSPEDWSQSSAEARRRCKRRAGGGGDARRVRLSILMKRGVKELPLPYALKKYVNLHRCFEF